MNKQENIGVLVAGLVFMALADAFIELSSFGIQFTTNQLCIICAVGGLCFIGLNKIKMI